MEPRNRARPGCRRAPNTRKATAGTPLWQGVHAPGGVADPWHARKHRVRDSGDPASGLVDRSKARMVNLTDTTMTHGRRESDSSIVPAKRPNNGSQELCRTIKSGQLRRRSWREGNWPRATRASKTGSGHSAG